MPTGGVKKREKKKNAASSPSSASSASPGAAGASARYLDDCPQNFRAPDKIQKAARISESSFSRAESCDKNTQILKCNS